MLTITVIGSASTVIVMSSGSCCRGLLASPADIHRIPCMFSVNSGHFLVQSENALQKYNGEWLQCIASNPLWSACRSFATQHKAQKIAAITVVAPNTTVISSFQNGPPSKQLAYFHWSRLDLQYASMKLGSYQEFNSAHTWHATNCYKYKLTKKFNVAIQRTNVTVICKLPQYQLNKTQIITGKGAIFV